MLFEDSARLEKIDRLYALRLDHYVSLPMLVVIGDQSCGKSSVLEALTGLPLPRDAGLCTRFPTQIVFKRSKDSHCSVKIISRTVTAEKKALIAEFEARHVLDGHKLDTKTILNLLEDASRCMGLPAPGEERKDQQQAFSHDTLKIEVSGPTHEHFSIVDLPGIFRNPTPGQTTTEDMDLVRKMISGYIKQSRSIILAVLSANIDLATQEVDHLAQKADPLCSRTLKVLTKPDLVDEGAEEKVIDLFLNKQRTSDLGYSIVCNRKQKDLGSSIEARNRQEAEHFRQAPWNKIPTDRAGISALRARLNNLLVEVSRRNYQQVSLDISSRCKIAHENLASLGRIRTNPGEQRLHLLDVASRYATLASRATDAYYGKDGCFREQEALRLATRVIVQHEKFSKSMAARGSTYSFKLQARDLELSSLANASDLSDAEDDWTSSLEDVRSREPKDLENSIIAASRASTSCHADLSLLDTSWHAPVIGKRDITKWITNTYQATRGFEIATINPSVLPSLFAEQIKPWAYHSCTHVLNVATIIHEFIFAMLKHVCEDDRVSNRLWEKIKPTLIDKYRNALKHVEFLVSVESDGNLLTTNHYFADNLKKARMRRMERLLQRKDSWPSPGSDREPLLRLRDVLDIYTSNEQHAVEDIYDALQAYYKVVRKRFVDAVCMQAINHFLISGPHTPLGVLSPTFVGNLSQEDLSYIAGEDEATREKRQALQAEIECLAQGQIILQA